MTTINKKEIEKFSKLAKDWWDPIGKFKPLHLFNPVRIKFIKEKLAKHFKIDSHSSIPLKNISVLDIGCGGGLLCEPLKRLGANITGIDASANNIKVAKLHAKEMNLDIKYINCPPENLKIKKKFDVILNMEIVEHVLNIDFFMRNCSKLIKKDGVMFVATINKNLKSYMFAILGAEYILRWLPIGTHDWNKFVSPQELEALVCNENFVFDKLTGVKFDLFSNKWKLSDDSSVNYISTFVKN